MDNGMYVSSIPSMEEFQSAYPDMVGEVDENIHELLMPMFDTKMRVKKKARTLTQISSRASLLIEEMIVCVQQDEEHGGVGDQSGSCQLE